MRRPPCFLIIPAATSLRSAYLFLFRCAARCVRCAPRELKRRFGYYCLENAVKVERGGVQYYRNLFFA